MLDQRRRRWANIDATLAQCLVFDGPLLMRNHNTRPTQWLYVGTASQVVCRHYPCSVLMTVFARIWPAKANNSNRLLEKHTVTHVFLRPNGLRFPGTANALQYIELMLDRRLVRINIELCDISGMIISVYKQYFYKNLCQEWHAETSGRFSIFWIVYIIRLHVGNRILKGQVLKGQVLLVRMIRSSVRFMPLGSTSRIRKYSPVPNKRTGSFVKQQPILQTGSFVVVRLV